MENERRAFSNLDKTRALIQARQVELIFGDAFDYLKSAGERFDVVFLDPPFRQNALPTLLERLPQRLAPGARVYVEAPEPLADSAWRELRRSRAGQVSYQLLETA